MTYREWLQENNGRWDSHADYLHEMSEKARIANEAVASESCEWSVVSALNQIGSEPSARRASAMKYLELKISYGPADIVREIASRLLDINDVHVVKDIRVFRDKHGDIWLMEPTSIGITCVTEGSSPPRSVLMEDAESEFGPLRELTEAPF